MAFIPNQAPLNLITTSNITANGQNFFSLDMSTLPYKSISIQITSIGGGGTIEFQGSNDNSTYYPINSQPINGGELVSSVSDVGQWVIPVRARYIRAKSIAYTSGTLTASAYGSQTDLIPFGGAQLLSAYQADYLPGYKGDVGGNMLLTSNENGGLRSRSQVLTDEGGYRTNAAGTGYGWAVGTLNWTAGSNIVTGTGILSMPLSVGDFIRRDADASDTFAAWAKIESYTDNEIVLSNNYTGTSGNSASTAAILVPKRSSGAGTITIGSGVYTITADNTTGAVLEIEREADVPPLAKNCSITISQRVANQNIYVGFYDEETSPARYFARFNFDGTTNTTVKTESGWNPTGAPSANETETYTITIPNGKTSAVALRLRVEVLDVNIKFYIDDVLVSTHNKSIPRPQDLLHSTIQIVNGTTPTTGTAITVDYDHVTNVNIVSTNSFSQTGNIVSINNPTQVFTSSVTGIATHHTIDCSQYRSAYLQLTSIGTSCTMLAELSADGATYVTAQMYPAAGGAPVTSATAVGQWSIPLYNAKYLKIRTSASYGTQTTVLYMSQDTANTANVSGSTVTVTAANLSCNNAQWAGQTAATGGINGTVSVGGLIAGDSGLTVATHKPLAGGGLAKNSATPYVVSADADAVFSTHTLNGAQVMYPYAVADCTWQYAAASGGIVSSTADVALKAAAAAGIRNYLTSLQVHHDTLSGGTEVVVKDGSTVIWRGYLMATANEMINIHFPVPLRGSAATALNFAAISSVTGGIYVNAQGFIGA